VKLKIQNPKLETSSKHQIQIALAGPPLRAGFKNRSRRGDEAENFGFWGKSASSRLRLHSKWNSETIYSHCNTEFLNSNFQIRICFEFRISDFEFN
jgi:hypothetical protein